MEGTIRLRVTFGTWPLIISVDVNFLVVDTPNMVYNAFLGRTSLNKERIIILTLLPPDEVLNALWDQLSMSQLDSSLKLVHG